MRVNIVGGGPAGLYFALLFKKAFFGSEVRVLERNRPDETFGWGVVFSDETLDHFEDADPETYRAITDQFVRWTDIEVHARGEVVRSTGHGFAGLSRRALLGILQDRCRALGVVLEHEREIDDLDAVRDADLVVGADGVNSRVRALLAEHVRPELDWRRCRFTWLGTDKRLSTFTFLFEENEHGLFQVHAYPFDADTSTFIVECHEDVWRRAGLEEASEADTVRYCEALFARHLDGHRLLTNKSIWRAFPTVRCERWHHENVVLLGDAAHTAHFSIGSGTKLAMEDAIALCEAFQRRGEGEVPRVLAAYEESRWVDVLKIQKAAQTSLEWFENSARYREQNPVRFTFNLLTRSKRITYENLALRDPALVEAVDRVYAEEEGAPWAGAAEVPPPLFTPFEVAGLALANRVVVSPMCQYSAVDGAPGEWHLVHYGSRALGGAGLVITEETNVAPEGRITPGCAGLYAPEHLEAWTRIVEFVHRESKAKIGIQLGHAGRKGSASRPWEGDAPLAEGAWETLGPSALPFDSGWPAPRAMDRGDMDRVTAAFARAATMAQEAGFDLVELHVAHGYLLSSFLSPLSNQRDDDYGGSLENRLRYPLEVLDAVRAALSPTIPLAVRLSASDWHPSGFTLDEAVLAAAAFRDHGAALLDISSAGNSPLSEPLYGRMYQVPLAERIRYEVGLPVIAVGALFGPDHVNTVLAAGRADLCALARPHLRDPYLTLHAAQDYGYEDQWWPAQYLAAKAPPPPSR